MCCSLRRVRFQSRFGADEGLVPDSRHLLGNFHHRGINILINGIFFGDADGFSDFESIDPWPTNASRSTRGRTSWRYGANSIGGAINFVPRTGYSASTLQMRMLGGSFRHGERTRCPAARSCSPFKWAT